jgi:hypothetical protein
MPRGDEDVLKKANIFTGHRKFTPNPKFLKFSMPL